MQARQARFAPDDAWLLEDVVRTEFRNSPASVGAATQVLSQLEGVQRSAMVERSRSDSLRWSTELSAEMVSVALLKPERMRTIDLFSYIRHLQANGQNAQRYEIEFWRKVFYPISCLVMVMLALPFAYLHMRSGGISAYVFAGVMIGISFFMMNNIAVYVGNLQQWQPWLAAAAPGLLYTAVSLAAFGWLVIRQ
jgi:lipopolysaccharide export system permease protein